MITVEKLKDKLQKEFGWENLDSNEYKWFIDNLLRDSIRAINYTRCCTELKGKETLYFEDWVKHNYREGKHKYYSLNGLNCLSYEEVLQKYNTYKQSL